MTRSAPRARERLPDLGEVPVEAHGHRDVPELGIGERGQPAARREQGVLAGRDVQVGPCGAGRRGAPSRLKTRAVLQIRSPSRSGTLPANNPDSITSRPGHRGTSVRPARHRLGCPPRRRWSARPRRTRRARAPAARRCRPPAAAAWPTQCRAASRLPPGSPRRGQPLRGRRPAGPAARDGGDGAALIRWSPAGMTGGRPGPAPG